MPILVSGNGRYQHRSYTDTMKQSWVIVADAARARIFKISGKDHRLQQIDDLSHPESQMYAHQLRTGGKGEVMDSAGFGQHQADPQTNTSEKHATRFAKELADYLQHKRADDAFTDLIIVAEPKLLGRLRSHLDQPTTQLVSHSIDKNWAKHDVRQIEQLLQQQS